MSAFERTLKNSISYRSRPYKTIRISHKFWSPALSVIFILSLRIVHCLLCFELFLYIFLCARVYSQICATWFGPTTRCLLICGAIEKHLLAYLLLSLRLLQQFVNSEWQQYWPRWWLQVVNRSLRFSVFCVAATHSVFFIKSIFPFQSSNSSNSKPVREWIKFSAVCSAVIGGLNDFALESTAAKRNCYMYVFLRLAQYNRTTSCTPCSENGTRQTRTGNSVSSRNFYAVKLSSKFASKCSLKIPPHNIVKH